MLYSSNAALTSLLILLRRRYLSIYNVTFEPGGKTLEVPDGTLISQAAEEAGIEVDNYAMSTLMEYQNLIKFDDLKS